LLTTILLLTDYCLKVFRPRLVFPGWAMRALIFSRVGACLPTLPPTCRRPDSYIAEGPREALRQLKSHQLLLLPLHKLRKITVEKACKRRMTLKATQGHWKPRHSIGHASLPITPFRSSGLEMKPAYFCPSPHRSIKIKRPNFSPVLLTKRYNSYWH